MKRQIQRRSARRTRALRQGYRVVAFTSATLLTSVLPGSAQEQAPAPTPGPRDAPAAGSKSRKTYAFAIPTQPLAEALGEFTEATGIRVLAKPEELAELRSGTAIGTFSADEALRRILVRANVRFRFVAENTVQLDREPSAADSSAPVVLAPLTVEAERSPYRVDAPSLPKLQEPLRDTPQSITSIPKEVLQDQGVATLRDTLRNVAGISIAAGEGGAQGDNVTVRGFSARGDIFLDGMRDFGSYYRDPFNLEAVEVLKGPSSILFGRGSTGGVVNQVSKKPRLEPAISGSLAGGTDKTKRATADVNEPLTALGEGIAFRMNAVGHESELAGRDIGENRHFGFAPSLAFGLGSPTRVTLGYFHQSEDDIPDYGIPFLFNRPAPVARHNFYGFKDGNFLRADADVTTATVEHKLTTVLSLRSQARYASYGRSVRITEAKVPTTVALGTAPSEIQVDRSQLVNDSTETFAQNQTDVTARFATGIVEHTVVAGVEGGRETSSPKRFTFVDVPTTSLLHPDGHQQFAGTSTPRTRVKTSATSVALYGLDTLKLGEQWEVMGGVRWDRFDASYEQFVDPAEKFDRVDDQPTYRAALVYKPLPIGSAYFSYGTSFNPSAESLSLSAGNANLPPEKNESFEVGTKWDLLDDTISVRGALFRTRKKNARETDPNNSLLQILSGTQRVHGFELETVGQLTPVWQILAGYAYLDSKITDSATASLVGGRIANTPKHTVSIWSTYQLPWPVEVGAGVRYVSSRITSTTPDPTSKLLKEVDGYWVVDAMAEYYVTDKIGLQVNVYNLADKYYFDQLHPGHIVPGAARSALFSTNFRF